MFYLIETSNQLEKLTDKLNVSLVRYLEFIQGNDNTHPALAEIIAIYLEVDGEDFIIYSSGKDLVEKIDYYSSHEDEMRTIAENGFNKLLKYHTSEVRAREFIETCERYMND